MNLIARARLHGETDAEVRQVVVEGADYDEAYEAARTSVPPGGISSASNGPRRSKQDHPPTAELPRGQSTAASKPRT